MGHRQVRVLLGVSPPNAPHVCMHVCIQLYMCMHICTYMHALLYPLLYHDNMYRTLLWHQLSLRCMAFFSYTVLFVTQVSSVKMVQARKAVITRTTRPTRFSLADTPAFW